MQKKYKRKFILLLISTTSFTISLQAQELGKLLNDTATVRREEVPITAPPIMAQNWNQIKTKYFTMNMGLAFLLDHNILSQDNNNITQVGKVDPGTEFRGERLIFTGNLAFFKSPWRYMVSANFNGLDAPQGKKSFDFIDWNVDIPMGKNGGWLTVGKQKEAVGLEYISPGTQGLFMERGSGAPMFVRQRNIGIRYSNSVMQQRMTYSIGFFNNYWESGKTFADNGSQITARVTALPIYSSDRDLMHVGIGIRYTESTDGLLNYKAKPEANTAPSFISTGNFTASSANTLMLEWIKVNGSLSFVGEYMNTFVNSNTANNPSFNYLQFGGSYFLTGENRRYNKTTANLGKLIPKKNFTFKKGGGLGAFELGARYTHSGLSSGNINGGVFNRFTTAVSWYPNAHFRYEINYGMGSLDKNNLLGKANFWQFRIQFEL